MGSRPPQSSNFLLIDSLNRDVQVHFTRCEDPTMRNYNLEYPFSGGPRTHIFDPKQFTAAPS